MLLLSYLNLRLVTSGVLYSGAELAGMDFLLANVLSTCCSPPPPPFCYPFGQKGSQPSNIIYLCLYLYPQRSVQANLLWRKLAV